MEISLKNNFLEKAKKVHGNKYNYSEVEYVNAKTKVRIICPEHGEFWQEPSVHIRGCGCPSCGGVKKHNTKSFINAAKQIHGDRYDYSKVNYINNRTKVCIICPEHGEFWQTPHMHLKGQGCRKCSDLVNGTKKRYTNNDFIERAKQIHGDKYDYSKVNYVNNSTLICISCSEHGEYLQTPHDHLAGCGCPKCKQSRLERKIMNLIKNVEFKYNEKPAFLNGLEADFIIEKNKTIIECQGVQHLIKSHFFEPLEIIIERDMHKNKLAKNNGYNIIYIISKKYNKVILDEKFNHMYDDALFIEDIEKDNSILLNKISETLN